MPRTNTTATNNTRINGGNNMTNGSVFSFEELAASIAQNIVTIQNRQNGVEPSCGLNRTGFATTSQFYGQVMADGEIYNPYLQRRFLPSQYIRLMKRYDGNINRAIKKTYDYKYMINHYKSEVNKLAMLERIDKLAYEERKNFLSIADARKIFMDYCRDLREALATSREDKNRFKIGVNVTGSLPGFWFIKGSYKEVIVNHRVKRELVKSSSYVELLNRIKHFEADVTNARTYQQLANVLNGFKFIPLKKTALTHLMVDRFVASGAFYTLKSLVNFEGVNVHTNERSCGNATESLDELRRYANKDGYVLHAILKKSIADSNYTI